MRRWAGIKSVKSCFAAVECDPDSMMAVLDLQHSNLPSVPSELLKHQPLLEELYLDANLIREVPRALFGLQKLQILGLSDNEISVLPSAVSNLVNLRQMDISRNGIIDLPESIKSCKCLEHFNSSVNPIGKIPDGFTHLLNLTHLYLNDAFLDHLPGNFGRLEKLKVLEVRENHLKALPKSMSQLTHLEILDIGKNEFTELPVVVGCLINLRELWMDCNSIRELPPEIGILRQLVSFDVSNNRLEWLPPEIEALQCLSELYLASNLLLELPENIGALGNLRTLKLEENHLSELPVSVGRLQNLEELIVSENELESLPSSLGFLRKLKMLNADENFLESIPAELGNCVCMTILSLRDNRMSRLPDDIGRMSSLQVVNLASNGLKSLPYTFRKLTNLKALWLSENQAKPMVPLQSEFDQITQAHVLTCFMFPQEPAGDEDPQIHSEEEGTLQANFMEEVRERSSIVFDIDEDDYLARLARYQSPYPKDVKDRALQYLVSKRQQQHEQASVPTQHPHQCHQQDRHQHRHQHSPRQSSVHQEQQRQQQPRQQQPRQEQPQPEQHRQEQHNIKDQPASRTERKQEQHIIKDQAASSLTGRKQEQHVQLQQVSAEVPWYEQQESTERQTISETAPETVVGAADRRVGPASRSRVNGSISSALQKSEASGRSRVHQISSGVPPGDRLIGGHPDPGQRSIPAAPDYQPPPPYSPERRRANPRNPPQNLPRYTSQSSYNSQNSFGEEAPSSVSSYQNYPTRPPWSSSTVGENSSQTGAPHMYSFNEEEPSFSSHDVLRPPSYHEATSQSNPPLSLGDAIHHVFESSDAPVPTNNSSAYPEYSPPPQYTPEPVTRSASDVGRQSVGSRRAELIAAQRSGQVIRVSDEEAQKYENRVRQLQRERAIAERKADRAPTVDRSFPPVPTIPRSSSSESLQSSRSTHSMNSSQMCEEDLEDDPSLETLNFQVYKNPNLGFSIGGGVNAGVNPFDPNDKKSIYVTKVQVNGPAYSLKPGDKIWEVNGINLRRVTHERAVMFLKNNQVVNLLIARRKEQTANT